MHLTNLLTTRPFITEKCIRLNSVYSMSLKLTYERKMHTPIDSDMTQPAIPYRVLSETHVLPVRAYYIFRNIKAEEL